MVSEKKIKDFFQFKYVENLDLRALASLNPRGLIGRIYGGDH